MTISVRSVFPVFLTVFLGTISAMAQSSAVDLYRSKCSMCHGSDGTANTPMGKMINVPSLISSNLVNATDATLLNTINNGSGKMAAYSGKLSDAQIADLLAYIRTLQK